jgi:hypothetical protein
MAGALESITNPVRCWQQPPSPEFVKLYDEADMMTGYYIRKPQESIGDVFGTTYEKIHMSQKGWREANRLHRIEAAPRRVTNDGRQHQEMRLHLVKLGMLTSPKR